MVKQVLAIVVCTLPRRKRMTEYEISTLEQIVKLLYEIRNELRMLRHENKEI